MSDTNWGQFAQLAVMLLGNEKASQMDAKQLELLGKQYADMMGIGLPDLEKMTPEQLGPSAVSEMAPDENLRGRQLQALGEIQNVIDSGGLDLSDKASLEEAMAAATNQQKRARAGVAADAAARGQANSGTRLVMDMDAAQAGANAARQTGLATAGMAQRRRLQAIQDSANMAGNLRESDWREKEAAARAKDFRDERNATAREKAGYYNAGLAQQQFNNQLAKTGHAQGAGNNLAAAYGANAAGTRAEAAGLVGLLGTQGGGGGGTGGGAYDGNGGAYSYETHEGHGDAGTGSHLDEDEHEGSHG